MNDHSLPGKTAGSPIPFRVHFHGRSRSRAFVSHAIEHLDRALGRFADRVQHVALRVRDINGVRGGVDQRCSLAVQTTDGSLVYLEETAELPQQALHRLLRRVRRRLSERRARRLDRRPRVRGAD